MHSSGSLIRVRALYDSLKSAERRLADHILGDPQNVVHSTVKELESKSGASYATIMRFCKKTGFSGYKEFKNGLVRDLMSPGDENSQPAGFPIDEKDTPDSISRKVLEFSVRTLQETLGIVDTEALGSAATALAKAGRVVCFGTGTSGLCAQYAFGRLFRLGIACSAATDSTIYKMTVATLGKNDVAFAISSSGRSANVVEAARLARSRGITVISLCDFAISPLSKVADINLYTTPRNVGQYTDIEMPLIIGQIAIIDMLFAYCASQMGPEALRAYATTKEIGDREKVNSQR